jgi:hypothetical protein
MASRSWRTTAIVATVGVTLWSARAWANGAFPDSLAILLAADRPNEIVLATNFGLIISEDDGQTWSWTCEQAATVSGSLYQMGPPPQDRIYAISTSGLVVSDDGSCSWTRAQGLLASAYATDAFPDPNDPLRVLALASPTGDASTRVQSLYASLDAGGTFNVLMFSAPAEGGLLGVETARSDPLTLYLSMYTTPGLHPKLVRSTDGSMSWTVLDVEPDFGESAFRIIAVDPENPARAYLRVLDAVGETLAVSQDGGNSFTRPVHVDGKLTAFARLASGTVLVGAITAGSGEGFRSTDGGVTFQTWPNPPRLRALAERGGKLFAAGDNFRDGFALAVSTDEGGTFKPLMVFDQVTRIKTCAQAICRQGCDSLAGVMLWSPEVCQPGGRGAGDGGGDASASVLSPHQSSCGCDAAAGEAAPSAIAFGLALTLANRLRGPSRRSPMRWKRP